MVKYPAAKRFVDNIDGIDNWFWPEHDVDLFRGPAGDWLFAHKKHYFAFLKNKNVCIQAGGACGMYPKLLAREFKTVYTFEPHYENFYFLNQNCPEQNIVKFNAALGSTAGFVSMEKKDHSNSGEYAISDKIGNVPIMTIDSFNFSDVDFIQLDVEGFDLEAILGGYKTIRKYKPVISVEIPLDFPKDLFYTMYKLGYVVMAKSMADLVFVHKSKI